MSGNSSNLIRKEKLERAKEYAENLKARYEEEKKIKTKPHIVIDMGDGKVGSGYYRNK